MTAKLRLPDEEPKDKPKRRPIPDHIPRMVVELTTGDDDCAQCGGALRRLGEDVTEELEYVPGRFIVNRIVRPRFACSGCEAFTQALLPSRPIERGRPGPGLLAHVLVNKYAPSRDIATQRTSGQRITCRSSSIGKAASSNATGSTLTIQRWPTGSANLPRCWNHLRMQSGGTCWLDRQSSQTTRPSRCSHPAPARLRQRGSGHMAEMNVLGAATSHRPAGISSRLIAKVSTQRITS
jgi:transposase